METAIRVRGVTKSYAEGAARVAALNGVDLDFTFVHAIAAADGYVRACPDSDGACDLSAPDSVAESLHECHIETLRQRS